MSAWLEFAVACGIVAGWGLLVYGLTYAIGAAIDYALHRASRDVPTDWLDK